MRGLVARECFFFFVGRGPVPRDVKQDLQDLQDLQD